MATGFRVTLLETGTPIPGPDRFGPSTLIEAGDHTVLIDAGRGATMRLFQLGIPIGRIDALLLTHFHSDHTVGIPDLWLTGWLSSHFGNRQRPFNVVGPVGTKTLVHHLEAAYAHDIQIRVEDEKLTRDHAAITVEEFTEDGIVYQAGDLRVTAFTVDHGDAIKPAYGYSIEHQGRVAVISGDTRYNANVLRFGQDADLLVHEVAMARPELLGEAHIQRIVSHHTSPQDAGRIFARAKPKLAAFTHLVMLASETVTAPTVDDLIAATRETYTGPLVVGEDLMSFEIGETVTMRRICEADLASLRLAGATIPNSAR
ncbi:MBL fold metallo-hydrolase [Bradyrhizobium septentrionale]|uniref:MBL fold metallo-hydrolase n=1 Tax=Bradyrhizobium septentrionale TaxID=1404411 RepID=A0ABZ2P4Y3_9BRAD